MSRSEKSFTLIELLVVIAIIGLLASVVLVSMSGLQGKAKITKTLEFSQSLQRNLGAYAVGVWGLDEGSGTTVKDGSGYNNNGTLINGPTFTSDTPHSEAGVGTGKYALSFDGVNDYVQVTDPPSLRVQTHTIEFWIKFNSIADGDWRPVLQKWVSASSSRAPGIWRGKDYPQRLHWRYDPGNVGFLYVGPKGEGTDFNLNEWYHIVGVKDGTTLKLYVNGKYVATATVPDPITQGVGDLRLGGSPAPAVILDELRIYEKALTFGEIQKRYADSLQYHPLVLE